MFRSAHRLFLTCLRNHNGSPLRYSMSFLTVKLSIHSHRCLTPPQQNRPPFSRTHGAGRPTRKPAAPALVQRQREPGPCPAPLVPLPQARGSHRQVPSLDLQEPFPLGLALDHRVLSVALRVLGQDRRPQGVEVRLEVKGWYGVRTATRVSQSWSVKHWNCSSQARIPAR